MPCFDHHSRTPHTVAVVGSTTIDRNVIGTNTFVKLGGVTTYAGITYHRHGLAAWIVTNISPEDGVVLDRLKDAGLRVLNGETRLTTRFVNHIRNGRRQKAPSLASPVRYSQLAALLDPFAPVDWVHLGPLHSGDIDHEVFERLRVSGFPVVLDVQGLVRNVEAGEVVPAVSGSLDAALQAARIVKADEEELQVIIGSYGGRIEEVMARFDIVEWVVTAGPKGGRIYSRDGGFYHYSSEPAAVQTDPTGAGDVFLAAYTVARWRDRKTIADASRHALQVSADQVRGGYIPYALLDLSGCDLRSAGSGCNDVDNKFNEG